MPKDVSPKRWKGRPTEDDKVLGVLPEIHRVESRGLHNIFENNNKRQQGRHLLARQLELDNLKQREQRMKNEAFNQESDLKRERKMLKVLEKIRQERNSAERHKEEYKKA